MEHHSLAIVAILTIGFGLACLLAYIARRLKLPVILGYLLAGYIIGPYSPEYVADLQIAEKLAEIGVILMLFGVGLHFKLQDLIKVQSIAIPGATIQTLIATITTAIIVYWNGGTVESGVILGLAIGVASTVVLVRVLTDNHLLNTNEGHIAVGWLVIEDIFTVLILILLPLFAPFLLGAELSTETIFWAITTVLAKFIILCLLMFTIGIKVVNYILISVVRLRSQELFTLAVIALMFFIAAGSTYVFDTSLALGAFIAGMVIGKTSVKHQAAANALPLKDIFAVIFFLSVGMLFNPAAILLNPLLFSGIVFVVLIVKPLSAFIITLIFKHPLKAALTIGLALAQIGEFSFILAEQALNLKLIPDEGFDVLVAAALVSISLNPLLFQHLGFFESSLRRLKRFSASPLQKEKNKLQKPSKYFANDLWSAEASPYSWTHLLPDKVCHLFSTREGRSRASPPCGEVTEGRAKGGYAKQDMESREGRHMVLFHVSPLPGLQISLHSTHPSLIPLGLWSLTF